MTFSFNLIDQPWIPCITMTGEYVECSLYELVTEAQHLREIHCETPLISAAILPMTLALLHRVYGPKTNEKWETLWQAEAFPRQPLEGYFEEWYQRFDLFDDEYPFFQAHDDRVEPKSLIHLVHSIGNTGTLFTHATDNVGISVTPSQSAHYLLTAQAFRTAGLSGLKKARFTDGPLTRGVLFFAKGQNFRETLMLNLVAYPSASVIPHTQNDKPFWERDDPFEPRAVPDGYLDYLTWPSVRILLIPRDTVQGITVSEATIGPGLSLAPEVEAPSKRYKRKKDDKWSFLYFRQNKALWRDYHSLLALDSHDIKPPAVVEWLSELTLDGILDDQYKLKITATGMLADQAKPIFYRNEQMPLSASFLRDPNSVRDVTEAISKAEDVAVRLKYAVRDLATSVLQRGSNAQPDKNDVNALEDQWDVHSRYWDNLEPGFWQFVEHLDEAPDMAIISWYDVLRQQALTALKQAADMAGNDPWALRGEVEADRKLRGSLNKILDLSHLGDDA